MSVSLPRLYAILDVDRASMSGRAPVDLADAWLDAGVRLIQVRAKVLGTGALVVLVDEIVGRARPAGAVVIVNDRADVARLTGADGVHLGQDDLPALDARRLLGDRATIGLSTHRDDQVRVACGLPVSYVAIGPVFDTRTKGVRVDPTVGLDGVRAAARRTREGGLPLVAIGGITLDRARAVIDAGATSVAVIADLLVDEPGERARRFLGRLADLTI